MTLLKTAADCAAIREFAQKVVLRVLENLYMESKKLQKAYKMHISYGIAVYNGEPEITTELLLRDADHEMYKNKRTNKASL